jgi:hypothetical protein
MSAPLARIKQLYYGASKATIIRDFDEAIDLLKTMTSDTERERATAYMNGLAELRAQWRPTPARPKRARN